MIIFRLQLRYGKRWGPLHPNVTYDTDLQSEFLFGYREYISSLNIYIGPYSIPAFNFETNKQSYTVIGMSTSSLLSTKGQRLLFLSGSMHESPGGPVISQVRVYFDAC